MKTRLRVKVNEEIGRQYSLWLLFNTSCVFPICLCHSVAIAGGELNIACSTARVVISIWATMIGHADTARRKFQAYAGVKAKRMGNVRWFTFWEVGAQLHDYYSAFKSVINDPDHFCEETRNNLKPYVNGDEEKPLRLELALIKDCKCLVEFCYHQEGDDFLLVETYI